MGGLGFILLGALFGACGHWMWLASRAPVTPNVEQTRALYRKLRNGGSLP